MASHLQYKNRRNLWYACVSVLVIGFLLYNPFIALLSHADGLAFQELARHRSTVGASEMQHYGAAHDDSEPADVISEEAFSTLVLTTNVSSYHPLLEQVLPQHPELVASVWFRPPPAA